MRLSAIMLLILPLAACSLKTEIVILDPAAPPAVPVLPDSVLLFDGPEFVLVEYEALAGDTYTLAEFMSDLREGVWGDLSGGSVGIDIYRRNLQRAYLAAADAELNPTEQQLQREGALPAQFRRRRGFVRRAGRAALGSARCRWGGGW